MKKVLISMLFLLLLLPAMPVFAAEPGQEAQETAPDASQPRVMVTDYEVADGFIAPNKKKTVKIHIKNFSASKAVKNIKLSISEETGDLKPVGMGTQYVAKIAAGGTYIWPVELTAAKTANVGEHAVTVSMEYEDKNYTAYAASDTIRLTVKQSVSLDYDGMQLPGKMVQGSTETLDLQVINTGKSIIRNCKIRFDIAGIETGGSTFIGEIPAGESKSATPNLRVNASAIGDAAGKITISYEDPFGKAYSKTVKVSTVIEKKVEKIETAEEEKEPKYKLWWLFLLAGAAAGGGIGFAIPTAIAAHKRRKEDELRL